MLRSLAVIPARGGSKGIPDKNLRDLYGKPLIQWSIETLQKSDVDHIVVSTDSDRIAERVRKISTSVEIVKRPDEISGDMARSEDAVIHAIDEIGWDGHLTLMVQATSPLTQPQDIDSVLVKLRSSDCVFSVVPFIGFVWKYGYNGLQHVPTPVNHVAAFRQRRQDRPIEFIENGAVYGFETDGFLRYRNRFFGKVAFHIMPEERSLEIDHPFHLQLAEMIMRKRIHTNSPKARGVEKNELLDCGNRH